MRWIKHAGRNNPSSVQSCVTLRRNLPLRIFRILQFRSANPVSKTHFAGRKFLGTNVYSGALEFVKGAFSMVTVALITTILLCVGIIAMLFVVLMFFGLCDYAINGIANLL